MRLLFSRADGGTDSGVRGFWLIEWKAVFSVVLLRFSPGSKRENYHAHAFSAWTWWLRGEVEELHSDGSTLNWRPSWRPKWTPRSVCHRIMPTGPAWAISFRGPWTKTWTEYNARTKQTTHLTNGRRVLEHAEL
jgi:hypothetical protein